MNFRQFFPLFRDLILGLTSFHIKNLAHRNIRPEAILKINEKIYLFSDFGSATNLSYEKQYSKDIFY